MEVSDPQPAAHTALSVSWRAWVHHWGGQLHVAHWMPLLYQHKAHVIGPLLPGLRLDVRSTYLWHGPPSL